MASYSVVIVAGTVNAAWAPRAVERKRQAVEGDDPIVVLLLELVRSDVAATRAAAFDAVKCCITVGALCGAGRVL